ncbi:MAG TPA: DsbA family protein [Solirubrobacteraceae bacterium]|nr:DsbA family protein [Solirubrobacteraceae bacterium]
MSATPASFYFDLSSPLAYLAAERVLHALPGPAEWQPVLAAELPGVEDPDAFRCEQEREVFRAEIARRVEQLRLQPLRWPEPFPFDSALAMRVATYAKSIGRTAPFAQAAFRQAFAGGRDLAQLDNVLIAAAACEMHPSAVARGAELRGVREQLAATTNDAARQSIKNVPAIVVGERVFEGERCVEQAAAEMAGQSVSAAS